jgi:hypothetical protein
MNPLVRLAAALSVTFALLFAAPARAVDSGDIVVKSVKGDVRVAMNGAERAVRVGTVLELPASVRTGRDGAIELSQGATSVNVGPHTDLEFPAPEKRGAPVDRIVQPRGNAFYDIGKREGRKLRVETPYLVGVIKGTQFNVAALADSTTISLFEGRLEVRAVDDSAVVDLAAGEIASRRRGDTSIDVARMNEKAPTTAPRPQGPAGGRGDRGDALTTGSPREHAPDDTVAGHVALRMSEPRVDLDVATPDAGAGANAPAGLDATPAVNVDAEIAVDTGVNAAGSAGTVTVDAGVAIDAGADSVSVDAGVSTGVDAGSAISVDADATADLGSGGASVVVDAGAGASVGAGDLAVVDTGANVTTDIGAGGVDVDASVAVDADVAGVDAGASAGVDAGAGTIDLGVTVGGLDVDLGVDLGLDDDDGNNGHGNDADGNDSSNPGSAPPANPGNIVDDVGGLLDGLLRRPGRR